MSTSDRHWCYLVDVSSVPRQLLHYQTEPIVPRLSSGLSVIMLLILHVYTLSCLSSHIQHTPWLMSHWVGGEEEGGHLSWCQQHWQCVLRLLCSSSHTAHYYPIYTGCTVQTVQRKNLSAVVWMSLPITNLEGVVRKTYHSHWRGPKLTTSSMDSVKRKVYPSHFLLSDNSIQCLVVIASLCHAECSHILMNATICMHKQFLRFYQSKLLYLEWTSPPPMTEFYK